MNKDLAIMYHYVMEPNEWKGSVPISSSEFKKQIKWLKENYQVVSPTFESSKGANVKYGIISFDDGTRDQYLNAYNILKEEKVTGYFTVMLGPLKDKIIPVFHLVHAILSKIDDKTLWNDIQNNFDVPSNLEELSAVYSYENNIYRRYNKYILNFLLQEHECRKYLEVKMKEIYGSLDQFIEEFYIQPDEIVEMYNNGMEIGVHCVHHRPYFGDAQQFYEQEIAPCKKYLTNLLGVPPKWYTPAFGGGENTQLMLKELTPILKENGFEGGFTTLEGFCDLNSGDFWHKRVDCNKLHQFLSKEGV